MWRASRDQAQPEDALAADQAVGRVRAHRVAAGAKLIAEGLTAKQIAETLFISQKTVDRHRTNVLEKLGLNDRVGLTRYAVRRG